MKVKISYLNRMVDFPDKDFPTKASIARKILTDYPNESVTEISKGVGMAYSQVHQIAKKMRAEAGTTPVKTQVKPAPITNRPTSRKVQEEARKWATKKTSKFAGELAVAKVSPLRGGKLLGPCSNCGFEIVGQKLGGQNQLVHRGMGPEEYLAVVQFCHAYPTSLAQP